MTNPREHTNGDEKRKPSGRRKERVAAKPLKADRVQPANGNSASSSNHDVLRRMYVSMLRCRMLAERAQHLLGGRRPLRTTSLPLGTKRSWSAHAGAGSGRHDCGVASQLRRTNREGNIAEMSGVTRRRARTDSSAGRGDGCSRASQLLLIRSTSEPVSLWPTGWRGSAMWSSLCAPTTLSSPIAGTRR